MSLSDRPTLHHSPTLAALFTALSKAQGQIRPALKDATNPHLRSKYADLASIWDACRDTLTTHGLSVSQWPTQAESGYMALTTVLGHDSGEFISSTYRMRLAKDDPQGSGSALTYMKRYALAAVLGIVGEDDDDAHAATHPRPTRTAPRRLGDHEPIGAHHAERLHDELRALGIPEPLHYARTHLGADLPDLGHVTVAQARHLKHAVTPAP
ncbi:ERF family protein [Deinococcus maricopensis]|uniref:ERF family protein n=1 Tax=Deinococcus maricopensis (strain DSM 21211 / LMG 22137 / NRRL B-23946 / LB-34) TaxID=709986 RepID=E8U8Q2_DEIML|nr:ERF family protein [Deinococcus maricopensis]ADV67441.1 ERF family protein [Deinococcus maricopensis DSM 21211]